MKHRNDQPPPLFAAAQPAVPKFEGIVKALKGETPAPPPRANSTRTSKAAATDIEDHAPTCRDQVLEYLRSEPDGATHEEIAAETGIRHDTVKPRVHELGEMGLVVALKTTRASSSGSQVLVFVATEHAGARALEPWPIRRTDWRSRALAAEALVNELRAQLANSRKDR